MADDVMDSFAEAVAGVTEVGVDPLAQPRQAAAVVADLVGDPLRSTADDFAAFQTALYRLAADHHSGSHTGSHADNGGPADLSTGPAGVNARPELVSRHLDALSHQLGIAAPPVIDDEPAVPQPTRRRTGPVVVGVAALAAVGLGTLAFVAREPGAPQESPASPTTSTNTTGPEPSSTTVAPPERSLSAVFPTVQEGPFQVVRSWKVTGTELVGVIVVERTEPGGGGEQRFHTELVPGLAVSASAEDLNSVRWNPEPTLQIGLAARFEVGQLIQGEAVEIQFFAPLRDGEPVAEAEVNAWYEAWVEEFAGFRNPLGEGDDERFDNLVGPSVTEE